MTVITPERSVSQRLDALEEANRIRSYRARLKKDIRAGRRDALAVLEQVPPEIETMRIFDLLLAMPRYGRHKVGEILREAGIFTVGRTIGSIPPRQRAEIVAAVRSR